MDGVAEAEAGSDFCADIGCGLEQLERSEVFVGGFGCAGGGDLLNDVGGINAGFRYGGAGYGWPQKPLRRGLNGKEKEEDENGGGCDRSGGRRAHGGRMAADGESAKNEILKYEVGAADCVVLGSRDPCGGGVFGGGGIERAEAAD